ncbi:hypothetical protein ACFVTC_15395 [Streptomyces sp. NPDC057950]|uniref:hypothetical protein n=1 Tax=Streptomyces sp. NPDC057950 TaxID=3346288 RepID=UPI0036E2111E
MTGSLLLAVLLAACGLAFIRSQERRRLVRIVKASAITGIVCYLLGCLQVVTTIPAHACPDLLEPRPTVHLVRYESGLLPPRAICHWDNGARKDFVSGWIDPLLLTSAAVLTAGLVAALVLSHRRHRNHRNHQEGHAR